MLISVLVCVDNDDGMYVYVMYVRMYVSKVVSSCSIVVVQQ